MKYTTKIVFHFVDGTKEEFSIPPKGFNEDTVEFITARLNENKVIGVGFKDSTKVINTRNVTFVEVK